MLGLHWAGISMSEKPLGDLLALQRSDGGWAQTPYLESDAYATGQVLYTLHQHSVSSNAPAYQRAVAYLLSTQGPDGSWHVRSRAPEIQPYFESGFPYGRASAFLPPEPRGQPWVSLMRSQVRKT